MGLPCVPLCNKENWLEKMTEVVGLGRKPDTIPSTLKSMVATSQPIHYLSLLHILLDKKWGVGQLDGATLT